MLSKNKLKLYQQLKSKKFRQKYGLFVVEGLKSVGELLNSQWSVDCILCTSEEIRDQLELGSVEAYVVSEQELKKISGFSTPSPVLAIAHQKEQSPITEPWSLALDQINDPGNLGTMIRIADWYGIKTIYCSEDTVDLYNPKVIQSSMGSFLRVNVVYCNLSDELKGKAIFAAVLDGANVRTVKAEGGVILIGGEANGIRRDLLNSIEHTSVSIPGSGNAESLNAAIATAVLCERLLF